MKRWMTTLSLGMVLSGSAATATAQCAQQDFESYADGSLAGSIPGLTFEAYDALGRCSSFPVVDDMGGNRVVATGFDSDPLCFSNPQDLHVRFSDAQETVTLSVGAATTGPATITVSAYSTNFGTAGLQDTTTITLSNASIPQPVTLVRNAADILRVRIASNVSAPEIVDDVQYTDATAPTAEISTPDLLACVCDIVTVRGIACDEDGTYSGDTLEYVRISPPDDNEWKTIDSAASPLCAEGALYNWDTTGLSEGLYRIRLRVFNACGAIGEDYGTVRLDKTFDTIAVQQPQTGNVYGGNVCFEGSIGDNCFSGYAVEFAAAGSGAWQPVETGTPLYTSGVTKDIFANWSTLDAGIPDGDYDLRVTGYTGCNSRVEPVMTVTVDNTPAVAVIDTPTTCSTLNGKIEFFGTASDAHMTSYSLQLLGGAYRSWTTFAVSQSPVYGDYLGTLDAEEFGLENCAYAVRLIVNTNVQVSCDGHTQTASDHMTFTYGTPVGSCPEDIDGDGSVALSDLAAVLAAFGASCP